MSILDLFDRRPGPTEKLRINPHRIFTIDGLGEVSAMLYNAEACEVPHFHLETVKRRRNFKSPIGKTEPVFSSCICLHDAMYYPHFGWSERCDRIEEQKWKDQLDSWLRQRSYYFDSFTNYEELVYMWKKGHQKEKEKENFNFSKQPDYRKLKGYWFPDIMYGYDEQFEIRWMDELDLHHCSGALHMVRFYMTGIGLCEVQILPDLKWPPKFRLQEQLNFRTICNISLLGPEYIGDGIKLNALQKEELISAINGTSDPGTFSRSSSFDSIVNWWMSLNEYEPTRYDYMDGVDDFDDEPEYSRDQFQPSADYIRLLPEF